MAGRRARSLVDISNEVDPRIVEVVAPNLKRRLSGVTSSIIQLVPVQRRSLGIAVFGPGLPAHLPRLSYGRLSSLWRRPASGRPRIWHARRNVEMVAGLVLKTLGAPVRLVFTSAGQRRHKPFTRWLIRRMDAIIATSARSGSFLEVPHTVVRHGIDLSAFHPPCDEADRFASSGLPGTYAVGCFGRVREQKGTDLFVEAMIALLPSYPDWTAVITGRVTAEHQGFADRLKARIKAAHLQDRIVFLGEVPDVKLWYRRVTLYVAPSRNEGFGLTPLEAMASGKPVVASDAGAYAEMIVPGVTGDVVPAGDQTALTEAIQPYLADPDLAVRHGEAALAHVTATFPIEREAEGVASVYRAVWARP